MEFMNGNGCILDLLTHQSHFKPRCLTLRGLNWKTVLVYVDDLLIFSHSFDEHLTHFAQMFDRLKEANLKSQRAICHFAVKEVKFLGHIISRQGVQVDLDNRQPSVSSLHLAPRNKYVASLAWPTIIRGLYKILPKLQFPSLNTLLSKDKELEWSEQCQVAFKTLKVKLISTPMSAYPDTF